MKNEELADMNRKNWLALSLGIISRAYRIDFLYLPIYRIDVGPVPNPLPLRRSQGGSRIHRGVLAMPRFS